MLADITRNLVSAGRRGSEVGSGPDEAFTHLDHDGHLRTDRARRTTRSFG